MNALLNWPRNRLLLALTSRNLKQLMPELEQIRCQRGQVLMDADSSLDHVFFPDSGVVSVVAVYADGSVIEMATIGREGCTGMQAFFGAKTSSVRLLVQIPGSAAMISRAAFARALESMPSFRNLMSAYIHAFLEQVLVSVALQRCALNWLERASLFTFPKHTHNIVGFSHQIGNLHYRQHISTGAQLANQQG